MKRYSFWFVSSAAIFITSLITANIIAVKLVCIFGLVMPAGIIIFPISYIFGDILTEVYGYAETRRVIWLGFLCNLVAVAAICISQHLPSAYFWTAQEAYERILGYSPRLLLASFLAYLCGSFANAFVMSKMKIATRGRLLWSRTIGSTIVGEGFDSLIFITIAFWGQVPFIALAYTILTQWSMKTLYEAAATPLTYVVVNLLKRKESIDAYDYYTHFTPFSLK